jgi:hypothetical protein
MVIQTTYTCTDPISFVSAPFPFRIRDQIYPFSYPYPVIIRSAPNPMKKHGRGYGKGKIRSVYIPSLD